MGAYPRSRMASVVTTSSTASAPASYSNHHDTMELVSRVRGSAWRPALGPKRRRVEHDREDENEDEDVQIVDHVEEAI